MKDTLVPAGVFVLASGTYREPYGPPKPAHIGRARHYQTNVFTGESKLLYDSWNPK